MGRLFGTDGVRGLANGDLTPELALSVAVAAARVLVESDASHQPLAIVALGMLALLTLAGFRAK